MRMHNHHHNPSTQPHFWRDTQHRHARIHTTLRIQLTYSLHYLISHALGNCHLRCSVSIGIIKPINASRRDLNNGSQASWESNDIERTSRAHAAPCPKGAQMQPCQGVRSWGKGRGIDRAARGLRKRGRVTCTRAYEESVQLRLAMSILGTHALGAGIVSKNHQRRGPTYSLNIGLVCAQYLSSSAPTQNSETSRAWEGPAQASLNSSIKDQEENHVRVTLQSVNRFPKMHCVCQKCKQNL